MLPRSAIRTTRTYGKRIPGGDSYAAPLVADMNSDFRAYNMVVTEVTAGGPVVVQDGCYAVMFTNTGDSPCTVNGIQLFPSTTVLPITALGDSYTIGGHLRDLYYGRIDVAFTVVNAQPALQIVQLFYIGILKDKATKK